MRNVTVSGQAVIEGVMMRGATGIATAVRTPGGEILVERSNKVPLSKKYRFFKLPVVRGAVALVDSMAIGMESLNFSASVFGQDEEPTRFERFLKDRFGEKGEKFLEWVTVAVSLAIGIFIFIIVPTLITGLLKSRGLSNLGLNLVEAVLRISIFIGYIVGISMMKDIYRVFQYHGAEHKAIACYEQELPLTVENVRSCTRYHERCGTNFMFLVMAVSIFIFSFTGWTTPLMRIGMRLALLPLVSGVTYEIIRWLGKGSGPLRDIIAYPGMMLQRLTTKEPTDDMIEVGIRALMEAEGLN